MAPTPLKRAYEVTGLQPEDLAHLQRLMGAWVMLADLSFSDLLLLVPVAPQTQISPIDEQGDHAFRGTGPGRPLLDEAASDGAAAAAADGAEGGAPVERTSRSASEISRLVVLGQVRPSSSQTLYQQDLIGEVLDAAEWAIALEAWNRLRIVSGELSLPGTDEPVRVQCIPVCRARKGHTLALLVRVYRVAAGRRQGELEQVYLSLFGRLAKMIVEGVYPFATDATEVAAVEDAPRVGDGILVTDDKGRITFCSPNAINALHRMGIYVNPMGETLSDLGIQETAVERSIATGLPVIEEIERRPDVTVLLHCTPLSDHGVVNGVLVAARDITDLRHRDRLLFSSRPATLRTYAIATASCCRKTRRSARSITG
ncbi:MAG: histidine kinase N-terminal domain-containing protein [Actinomycetota bacterium]|nr:histidine kinase N-terminal domain-containing protein [Actinomycetota bacterium]